MNSETLRKRCEGLVAIYSEQRDRIPSLFERRDAAASDYSDAVANRRAAAVSVRKSRRLCHLNGSAGDLLLVHHLNCFEIARARTIAARAELSRSRGALRSALLRREWLSRRISGTAADWDNARQ